MFETLSLTGELIERTSSTIRVQEMVQLSLAPVFLLAGIGAMLNVMNLRLTWLFDRIEFIERREEEGLDERESEELPALRQRQRFAQMAVNLSTSAALTICIVIAILFISAFVEPRIGTVVAFLWIATMFQLSVALALFFRETSLASASVRERRKRSRELVARQSDSQNR
ncbi:DUF2721 domain-containing protein [Aurantiacibacter poecillastricola]|uniref:DUF2721 domain-containing protein n=1 Tax=Aurantiacibacter poecillastricola TaxID=3064385 RepID=UPI00273DCF48|nr:DUF2721 domain-containing protein [Aurantiacibacter sp. 219JJ12-13]MDP5262762.1 DUF2721 domain-containing protein [Aurantiacibacter sp. 219JJ12-13]